MDCNLLLLLLVVVLVLRVQMSRGILGPVYGKEKEN
jgi:hypothetical protein